MWIFTIIFALGVGGSQCQVADLVRVTTYYETLCPDCIRFFTTQLEPAYNELRDIMIIEDYAYGFIKETPLGNGYNFTCQHGPAECYTNKLVTCGRKWIADHEAFLKFLFCVMKAPNPPSAGGDCAKHVGVPYFTIGNCANSTEGEKLLHEVGLKQAQLQPKPLSVPWIIINDKFSQENMQAAQDDLMGLVCSTYQGPPPPACIALLLKLLENIKAHELI